MESPINELLRWVEQQTKQADVFSSGNVNLFPQIDSQQKWRYGKETGKLHLHDGQKVYTFSVPENTAEEDFEAHRHGDIDIDAFEKLPAKGTAQVHRADPGSIYFTLHEGKANPTYTFKHMYSTSWRGMPKKKKNKLDKSAFEKGMQETFEKTAIFDYLMDKLNQAAKHIPSVGNKAFNAFFSLGANSPAKNALMGAGLGGAYHLGRRALYNTPEENEEENADPRTALRRVVLPALAFTGLGYLQPDLMGPNYYNSLAAGKQPKLFN